MSDLQDFLVSKCGWMKSTRADGHTGITKSINGREELVIYGDLIDSTGLWKFLLELRKSPIWKDYVKSGILKDLYLGLEWIQKNEKETVVRSS